MNQHFLKKDCTELHAFPHIIEYALKKNNTIQFDSLKKDASSYLRFYYVAVYMKHYAIFERLSAKLFDEFEAIADLQ